MTLRSPSLLKAFAQVAEIARIRSGGRVPVLAISGAQGSGKSTLLESVRKPDPRVAGFSLDDVYLTKSERQALAEDVHPLFATRGVPGTHDLGLLQRTLESLGEGRPTRLPAFDKLADDRKPESEWSLFEGTPSLIIVEGWCIGATPEPDAALRAPINRLEEDADKEGRWRRKVNAELASRYQEAFKAFDAILYLKAPSFEVVNDWRAEQEAKLRRRPLVLLEKQALIRFVQHFERITRRMIKGGVRADIIAHLAADRSVTSVSEG